MGAMLSQGSRAISRPATPFKISRLCNRTEKWTLVIQSVIVFLPLHSSDERLLQARDKTAKHY